jgi:hypothetical protein
MKRVLLISGILLLAGCSSSKVTRYNAGKNLADYKTYNYMKFKYSHYDSIPYNEKNYAFFIKEMDKRMQEKGLELSDNPNLIINVGVAVRQEEQTRETDFRTDMNYAGNQRYHWEVEDQVVGVYDVGDMTLDFVDVKENTLVWQAVAESMLSKNEQKMQKRISKSLDNVFEEFPSK